MQTDFECVSCAYSTTTKENLDRHMQYHQKKKSPPLESRAKKPKANNTCQICAKEFSRKDSLTRHFMNVHKQL